MARIQSVDYEAMPRQAGEMRNYGKQLNNELVRAYTSLAEMHDSWYGIRYNELVKSFNEMIPKINDMLTLVVKEIPCTLEKVANNYSQADRGSNITAVNNEEPQKITTLVMSNDVGMKFVTASVSSVQKNISNNFKNAKEQMNNIESAYLRVNWQSEASESFKSKFTKLKNDIIASFENLDTQFTQLMAQTEQDIENVEKANNVN